MRKPIRRTGVRERMLPPAARALLVRVSAVLAVLLLSAAGSAGPALVPAPLRAAIIVRSVGYERGFAGRSGDAVLAVVLGSSGGSSADGKAMAAVFEKLLGKTRIANRRTRVVRIVHESPGKTAQKLKASDAEIVYLANGLEGHAAAVPAKSGNKRRIVVCSHGSQVSKGCALGVELAGDKPRLVVNLKRASAVGLRFDPALLGLARVVR